MMKLGPTTQSSLQEAFPTPPRGEGVTPQA